MKTTAAKYDAIGNLIAVTDELGRTSEYTYNSRNWLSAVRDPLGQTIGTEYDANGNTIAVTDALGHVTRYNYDPLNRQIAFTDTLNKTTATCQDTGSRIFVTAPQLV